MDSRESRLSGGRIEEAAVMARVLATTSAALPRPVSKSSASMSLRAETVSRSILEEALDSLRRSRGVNGRSALAASESKRETAATASASAAARRVGRVRAASAISGTTAAS
jgi:hypothetical protein